jgi:DNA-binding MarR family transcriptional regulator
MRNCNNSQVIYQIETILEFVFTTLALFLITAVASILFYHRIRLAQNEYETSKMTVRNITSGFTRQVTRMEKDIHRVEAETVTTKILVAKAISNIKERDEVSLKSLETVKVLNVRVDNIEESIDQIKKDLKKMASQPRQVISSEVEAPIPVQGESILQRLTETELEVLTMIGDIGEGTGPQIREQIGKTREHTARLLKKLYENGFIDRNTSRMPYRYSVRKEIKDLIQESKESTPLSL